MIATIIDWRTIGKVVLYSLLSGAGIAVIFGVGVASAAGLLDALRERRTVAGVAWGALATICVGAALAAIVLGLVVMSRK